MPSLKTDNFNDLVLYTILLFLAVESVIATSIISVGRYQIIIATGPGLIYMSFQTFRLPNNWVKRHQEREIK